MPTWLPSIPYGPAREDGYWAPVTSTLNWCEEDYYATHYAAEIVNTVTNLLFVILAFRGMRNCLQNGHENIFFITFVGYLVVGTGSGAFHASLKYPMQLVDELSMIYTTCLMCWATFAHTRTKGVQLLLGLGLAALALFITAYYHYLQDPAFHQNAYALLTAIVLLRSMYVMETRIRPYFRKRREERGQSVAVRKSGNKGEEERQDQRDREVLRLMWLMVGFGLTVFLGGFGVWNLDNVFCGTLRRWRRELGLPWGILLEGHGWWHLMTGLGAYFYITWGIWLRHCLNGRQDEFELVWPSVWTSIPFVVKKDKAASKAGGKALANGGLKQA